jgi:hypothetical protein
MRLSSAISCPVQRHAPEITSPNRALLRTHVAQRELLELPRVWVFSFELLLVTCGMFLLATQAVP